MNKQQLGLLLRAMRNRRGFSTTKMEKAGMRFEILDAIEKGSTSYTIDSLLKYMEIIKIKINLTL